MKRYIALLTTLLVALSATLRAQEVSISVAPTSPVLPPQAGLYLSDPGKFFTVTLTNMGTETAQVFLGIEIEQTLPGEITLHTPTNIQPQRPVTLPPNATVTLSRTQLADLFRQMSPGDIVMTGGNINDFTSGTVGLMPEGHYLGHVIAYRWDPAVHTPEALSDPSTGRCQFDICYKADAPVINRPVDVMQAGSLEDIFASDSQLYTATTVDFDLPVIFGWTPVTQQCASVPVSVLYDIEFYRLNDNLSPEEAILYGEPVHHIYGLSTTQYTMNLPLTTRKTTFIDGCYYVVRVKATHTANDSSRSDYMLVSNDGYSPLRVIRVKPSSEPVSPGNDDEEDNDEDDETEDNEEPKLPDEENIAYFSVPTLSKPEAEQGINTANRLKKDTDVEVAWSAPVYSRGIEISPTFKYKVGLYKMAIGDIDLDELLKTDPAYSVEDITELTKTLKWSDLQSKVTVGEKYMLIVTAYDKDLSDKIKFTANGANCYHMIYYDDSWTDEQAECNPGEDEKITNKTSVEIKDSDLKGDGKKVKIGQFDMVITSAKKTEKQNGGNNGGSGESKEISYSGEGYVIWRPYGKDLKFAVSFDTIYINSEDVVFKGEVRTKASDGTSDFVNLFSEIGSYCDEKYKNNIGGTLANLYPQLETKAKEKMGDYYKYVHGSAGYINTAYNLIASGFDSAPTSPMSLPLGMPTEMYEDMPFDISMTHMIFSPNTAYLSLIAMFKLPGSDVTTDDQILAFGCPRLCITPDSPWAETGSFGLLYDLVLDDPDSNFKFSFNAPRDWKELNTGTFITWKNSKFDCLGMDVSFNIPDLKKDDGNGNTNGTPAISLRAQISDWDDWMAQVEMDPFQIEECPGFTIVPGGKITYDHSRFMNIDGFKLPNKYKLQTSGFTSSRSWQGLHVERMQLKFPKVLEFSDEEESDDELGEAGDEAKATKSKDGRLALSFDNFFLDVAPKGVFASFSVSMDNLIKLKTCKAGGWGISLDKIYFDMVQNSFSRAGFLGSLDVPILDGTINYEAVIAPTYVTPDQTELQMEFKTVQADSLSLDIFLAKCDFLKEGTYFRLLHKFESDYQQAQTDIELLLSGKISILSSNYEEKWGTKKPKLSFELPQIKFVGMRLANKKYETMHEDAWLGTGLDKAMEASKNNSNSNSGSDSGGEGLGYLKTASTSDIQNETDEVIIEHEHELIKDKLYFSLGNFSLASPQKGLWGLPIILEVPKLARDDADPKKFGLELTGGIALFNESGDPNNSYGVSAKASFTIWTEINGLDEAKQSFDLSKLDIDYKDTEFKKIDVDGSFAGGTVLLKGALEVSDKEDVSGFEASLEMTVKDLFKLEAAGGYYEVTKTEADLRKDSNSSTANKTYKAAFFAAGFESAAGVQVGPVTITGVNGGFLFNMGIPSGLDLASADMYEAVAKNHQLRYKSYGGAFGVKMKMGSENAVKGEFGLILTYDAAIDKLSNFHFVGTVDALNLGDDADGLVHAKADIIYEDTRTLDTMDSPEVCQSFTVCLTVDAKADMAGLYKDFTGQDFPAPNNVSAGLDAFSSDQADDKGDEDNGEKSTTSADGSRTKSEAEKKAEKNGFISGSVGATISLEFQFRNYPNKTGNEQKKWHFYLGKPTPETERCRITFLDFSVGKDKPVGYWAKVYANAYLCFGNELPSGEVLPPIPAKVQEVLGEIGADGKSHSAEYTQKIAKAQQELIKNGPAASGKGGFQFGAALGAEWGVNAVFCYAAVEALMGIDVLLTQYDKNCQCAGGGTMGGQNGFYGTGQIYAMMRGEMGLQVDLWLYKGKVPLVTMELAALLKGGLPNPTWAYGKVKAKGDILNGLIKFNSSVEMRAGRVCIPEQNNPLDDVQIFGDYSLGSEEKSSGWADGNEISPNPSMSFSTNMSMGAIVELVDENRLAALAGMSDDIEKYEADARRTYRFLLADNGFETKRYQNKNGDKTVDSFNSYPVSKTADKMNYSIDFGALEPESYYGITLRGYAEEKRGNTWGAPYVTENGHEYQLSEWHQDLTLYFKTGKLSENAMDNVKWTIPFEREAPINEAERPQLILDRSRADLWNSDEYEYFGQLQYADASGVNNEIGVYDVSDFSFVNTNNGVKISVEDAPEDFWKYMDVTYWFDEEGVIRRMAGTESRFEHIVMAEQIEEAGRNQDHYKYCTYMPINRIDLSSYYDKNYTYRFRVIRVRRAELQLYMDALEEKFKSLLRKQENGETVIEESNANAAEADPESAMAQEMLAYYNSINEELGSNEADQRMMEYRNQLQSDAQSKFSDVIYTTYYKLSGDKDFAEWTTKNGKEYLNKSASFDHIQYQVYDIRHTDTSVLTPYQSIMWWNDAMASGKDGYMPSTWRFAKSQYLNVQKLTINTSAEPNEIAKYRAIAHSDKVEIGDDFAEQMSLAQREKWIDGFGYFGKRTNEVKRGLVNDAWLAAKLDYQISQRWKDIRNEKTYTSWKSFKSSDSKFTKWKDWTESHRTAMEMVFPDMKMNTLEYPFYQITMMYSAEDRQKEYNNSDWKPWLSAGYFGRLPMGAIYKMDMILENIPDKDTFHGTMKGLDITVSTVPETLNMPRTYLTDEFGLGTLTYSQYEKNYSNYQKDANGLNKSFNYTLRQFDYYRYVNQIKGITYRVRRLTGYNCAPGNAGENMRPSTAGEFQAAMTIKIWMDGSKFGDIGATTYNASNVTTTRVDTVWIKDPAFRRHLSSYDTNHDGAFQRSEINAIKSLSLTGTSTDLKIKELIGLESMVNLEYLYISSMEDLVSVPLATLQNLKTLTLNLPQLELLDLTSCPNLETVEVSHTTNGNAKTNRKGLKELRLRGNTKLKVLKCENNRLDTLALADCRSLETLICHGNKMKYLDVSMLPNLIYNTDNIRVGRQYKLVYSIGEVVQGVALWNDEYRWSQPMQFVPNLVKFAGMRYVMNMVTSDPRGYNECTNNSQYNANCWVLIDDANGSWYNTVGNFEEQIKRDLDPKLHFLIEKYSYWDQKSDKILFNADKMREETSLDISNLGVKSIKNLGKWMPKLKTLICSKNEISEIVLSEFSELTYLDCEDNKITSITTDYKTKLQTLYCSNNQISAFNTTLHPALEVLQAENNRISALILNGNQKLKEIYCANNKLELLDFATVGSTLTKLDVSDNTSLRVLENFDRCTALETVNFRNDKRVTFGCTVNTASQNLKEIDISNSSMYFDYTGYHSNLVTLKASGAGLLNLKDDGTTFDVSRNWLKLRTLDLSNQPGTTRHNLTKVTVGTSSVLQTLNVSHGVVESVTIRNRVLTSLKMGAPISEYSYYHGGNQVVERPKLYTYNALTTARWEAWKQDADNYLVLCYSSDGQYGDYETTTYNSRDSEESIKEMKEVLGATLYQRLYDKYAKGEQYFTPSMAMSLDSLDMKGVGWRGSIKPLEKYFSQVTWMDCSQNFISEFRGFENVKYLDLSDNEELEEMSLAWLDNWVTAPYLEYLNLSNTGLKTMVLYDYSKLKEINVSGTPMGQETLAKIISSGIPKVIARDCKSINGAIDVGNSVIEYLDISGSTVTSLKSTSALMIKHIDAHGCSLASATVSSNTLTYLDLHGCHIEKMSVSADALQLSTLLCGQQRSSRTIGSANSSMTTSLLLKSSTLNDSNTLLALWMRKWSKLSENTGVTIVTSSSSSSSNSGSSSPSTLPTNTRTGTSRTLNRL